MLSFCPKRKLSGTNGILQFQIPCAFCQNGSCEGGECRCHPGFEGADCDKDRCAGIVCKNGGSCFDGSCICPPGASGKDCSQLAGFKYVKLSDTTYDEGKEFAHAQLCEAACLKLCDETPACAVASHKGTDCWLREAAKNQKPAPGVTSFIKGGYQDTDPNNTKFSNTNFYTHDMDPAPINGKTEESCIKLCNETPGCVVASYRGAECWRKNKVDDMVVDPTLNSYIKGAPVVDAPDPRFTRLINTDYEKAFAHFNLNEKNCLKACAETPACAVASHKGEDCWLRTKAKGHHAEPGVTSFIKGGAQGPDNYTKFSHTNFFGNDKGTHIENTTEQQCLELCSKDKHCAVASHSGTRCWLKTKPDDMVVNGGMASFVKEDRCAAVTCKNGGSCHNGACICPAGFRGRNCEHEAGYKYAQIDNTNYYGNDLFHVELNQVDCLKLCDETPKCGVVTHAGKNCWLKYRAKDQRAAPGMTSFIKGGLEGPKNYTKFTNTNFYGHDIGQLHSKKSEAECIELCNGNPACAVASHRGTDCWLKDKADDMVADPFMNSFIKGVPQVKAPQPVFTKVANVNYYGNDFAHLQLSEKNCLQKCADTPECGVVTHKGTDCWLKYNAKNQQPATAMNSFIKGGVKVPGNLVKYSHTNFFGNDIGPMREKKTEQECIKLCSETPGCLIASHRGTDCWLKNKADNMMADLKMTSFLMEGN